MKMTIESINIPDDERNKVTSDKLFAPRKIKDANGDILFHEDGIFSNRIFGKFGKCKCGKLTKVGICPECNCRVISKKDVPIFYIEFNFDLPKLFIEVDSRFNKNQAEIIRDIYNYSGFLYDGNFVKYDIESDNSIYSNDKILIGKEALLSLGVTEEEYEHNVYRKVAIPHTSYRKIIIHGDQKYLGEINNIFIKMIKLNNEYADKSQYNSLAKIIELNIKYDVSNSLSDLYDELFNLLADNNRNVVDNELKGQPETGMIRAVMTNNFSLDEDELLIGSYFIPTLYPYLFKENSSNGKPDIDAINKILKEEEYLVLFNRQPTIGAKSIIAMKPRFSKLDSEKYVIQANPIIYDGLAGDVDGDALNVISVYAKVCCDEAKKLLPSINYVEGSNDSIRNKLPEDFEYVKGHINKKGKK